MRRSAYWIGLAVALLAFGPAAAEVIHFTNGTTMAISGYTVEDGMVHVGLGPDSTMAFPQSMVERIVNGSEEVYTSDGTAPEISNKMISGSTTPVIDTRVTGRPMSHQINGKWVGNTLEGNPRIQRDPSSGVAVYQPFGNPGTDSPKNDVRVTGRLDMLNSKAPASLAKEAAAQGLHGAKAFGRGFIAKMPEDTGIRRPMLNRFTMKPVVRSPPPPPGSDQ